MESFCTRISQNTLFLIKEEANEIQRSQKNYFLFNTSENIFIFVYFEANQTVPKLFSKRGLYLEELSIRTINQEFTIEK